MKSPVDIKAVLDAVTDTETARNLPVNVHLYLDATAPQDVTNLVLAAFKTTAENATVSIDAYPEGAGLPDPSSDMAVIVAGTDERTGRLCADLRLVSVPSMVVTTLPQIVRELAESTGHSLLEEDIVFPDIEISADALADSADAFVEPYFLSTSTAKGLQTRMGRWIVDVFREKRLAFANAFACVRRPLSEESVNTTSIQNAGIGLVLIIPGADLPIMTLNQLKMLLQIAAAYGQPLSLARAKEMLPVIGGGFACRAVARQVVDFVPVLGWAVKAGIGYGGTYAMGRALVEYFAADGDIATLAKKAGDAMAAASQEVSLSKDGCPICTMQTFAASLGDTAVQAAKTARERFVPMVRSVARAAGEATGFTPEDLAGLSSKVVDGARRAGAKHGL